jgi:pimeloyl-ACP methyl ester carboxylesterase
MTTASPATQATSTVVVTHGAWSAGWVWKKMRPRLAAHGIDLWTPTYTGVGERSHLARPDIDLDTHIADIVAVMEYEDLSDVTILAHSYGGMVGTGVCDRVPERVRAIIYLDAFVPSHGQSLVDLVGEAGAADMAARAAAGDGWQVAPNPPPPDTSPEDIEWVTPRRGPQPYLTFTQPITLEADTGHIARSYIYCQRCAPGDVFRQFSDRAAADPQWQQREIDASHNPHITCPDELTELIRDLL